MDKQLTKEEFGKTIKQRYTQYKDFSDLEVAEKVLAKYPEYSNKIKDGISKTSSFTQRAGQVLSKAGESIKRDVSGRDVIEKGESPITSGFQAVATASSVPLKLGYEALPQAAREGLSKVGDVIGGGFSALTSKIGDIPQLQEWVTKNPQAAKNLEELLKTTSAAGEIAGNVLIADQATKLAGAGIKTGANVAKQASTKISEVSSDVLNKTKEIFSKSRAKVGDQIIPIPQTVKTTLKRVDNDMLGKYINQAKQATIDQQNATPLELAGDRAVEALNKIQDKLSTYGKLKSGAIGAFGEKNVGTIATKFRQTLENSFKDKNLIGGDKKLVNDIITRSKALGNNPTASRVDSFIDEVQDLLYTSSRDLTVPVTDSITSSIRKTLGELNSGLKAQLPKSYAGFNDKYANLVGTRDMLNKALGLEADKGGSLLKRVFSPTDSGTKKLFNDVLKETGINLTDEAVLAKFAMELFGDPRQASILEKLSIPTQRGLIEKIIEVAGGTIGVDDYIRNLKIKKASSLTK